MKTPVQIYGFTSGQLDREMQGRMDLKAWYSGCLDLTNMVPRQLGGADPRPGTAMIAEISEAAAGARLARFEKSTEAEYLHVLLDAQDKIFHEDAPVATVITPWTPAQLSKLDWTQSLDTMLLVHPDVEYRKLVRQGDHATWALSTLAITDVPTYDFGSGAEAIWSATRGWPGAITLHQGRLYFGASKSRPNRVDGSMADELFKFTTTVDSKDDEAVSASLLGDQVNAVRQLFGSDDLFILTTAGVWAVATSDNAASPSNFVPRKYGAIPSSSVRPRVVNGHVVFISEATEGSHASLFEMAWDNDGQSYFAQDLATRCPSIVNAPKGLAVLDTSQKDSAPTSFVVNGDGTLAVLTPNRFENVTAWSKWITDGQVLDVEVVGRRVYFLVKRTIDGTDRYFLERLDPDRAMDCSLALSAETPQTVWGGLDHLEGKEVGVLADGHLMPRQVVSGGQITLPEAASAIEVGLVFSWKLVPMPIEAQLADGTLVGHRFRIPKIAVRVEDTAALWIDGKPQTFRRLDSQTFDAPLPLYSGVHSVRRLGWYTGGEAFVTLEGRDPLPATILSITVEVAQ